MLCGCGIDNVVAIKEAEEYSKMVGMDQKNTEALKVLVTQGKKAAIDHMMKNPYTGEPWTYAESRAMYG